MKSKKNIICLGIILLFTLAGCKDSLLEEEHPTEVTTDFLYTTPAGLQSAVTGLYDLHRSLINGNSSQEFASVNCDGGTDITITINGNTGHARYREIADQFISKDGAVGKYWKFWYNVIERTNSIITYGEESLDDGDEKEKILREAYLYRGYAYLWLVRRWENIWLNVEPTTIDNLTSRVYEPADTAQVWAQVISDLETAIDYYNEDWTYVPGRLNLGVAHMLRADAALWQEDWDAAIEHAEKVYNEGPFGLESVYNVFDGRKNDTKETMFAIQYDAYAVGGGGNSRIALQINPLISQGKIQGVLSDVLDNCNYGWGRMGANDYLMGLYDQQNDKRYDAYWRTIFQFNDPDFDYSRRSYNYGDTLTLTNINKTGATDAIRYFLPACKKYFDLDARAPLSNSKLYNNIYIFRYPWVLLVAAEAHLSKGNVPEATAYINELRENRIDGPTATLATVTEEDILAEYARELGLEGYRWELLKRHGKLVERVRLHNGQETYTDVEGVTVQLREEYIESRTNIQDYMQLWPIPYEDLLSMGETFPQNPGYKRE
ncbi:RagB/SusD family nutrient uptake outer membrane protein [Geofilum sp. OHC36d9]|uniref:RagB/SusD family nutrient uptake outer membrane protein n=1 Tax=Geofilum sp. OHC36d9 TaxID=3458413 RepID=UPI0040331E1B